jgi:hypothetical protein
MKRIILPAVLVVLLGGLAPVLRAEPPCCLKQPCCANADAQYTNELLDILQTTHSVDTFVVTLNLLVDTDVEPRMAIPLIIRNAERIGVFADTLQDEDQEKPSALVVDVIGTLKNRLHAHQPPTGAATGCAKGAAAGGSCEASKEHYDPFPTPPVSDNATPVLPPLHEGSAQNCDATPSDAEILRVLHLKDAPADAVTIVKEKIVDHVDEPRFYPLVGIAQMHHCHWKCTVNYRQINPQESAFWFELSPAMREYLTKVTVVYIDKDHLHLCPSPKAEKGNEDDVFPEDLIDWELPSNGHH